MSDRHHKLHELLLQHLAELKLGQIAQVYREVLDEAARKNAPFLEVLASLIHRLREGNLGAFYARHRHDQRADDRTDERHAGARLEALREPFPTPPR